MADQSNNAEKPLMEHAEFQALKPYMGLNASDLTVQEERFVQLLVSGMSIAAAGRAAGYQSRNTALDVAKRPKVAQAIDYFRKEFIEEVKFSRTNAHTMYMDAWSSCANATEMKNTVDSLVKLHGLSTPEPSTQVNIQINGVKQLERMSDEELLKIAGQDADYLEPK